MHSSLNNANVIHGAIGLLIATIVGAVLGYVFTNKEDKLDHSIVLIIMKICYLITEAGVFKI